MLTMLYPQKPEKNFKPQKNQETKQEYFDSSKPYAELWIGAHINGYTTFFMNYEESQELDNDEFVDETYGMTLNLLELIELNPDRYLGEEY